MALGAGSACFWITCTGGSWVSVGAGVGAAVPAGAGAGVGVVVVAGGLGVVAPAAGGDGFAAGGVAFWADAGIESSRREPTAAASLNFRPFILPPPRAAVRLSCSRFYEHSLRTAPSLDRPRRQTDKKPLSQQIARLASDSPTWARTPTADRIGNFSRLSLAGVRQVASRPAPP